MLTKKNLLVSLLTTTAFISPNNILAATKDFSSASIWGGQGLLRVRDARFSDDGSFKIGVNLVNPYKRYHLTWQVFPWMEGTFRYSDITNRPSQILPIYQSEQKFWDNIINFEGQNSYLDRSFDVKFRLVEEGNIMPQIALGFQDFLGTGVWSSEYFVASKKINNFDISFGIGWGNMGGRKVIKNPFAIFSDAFANRTNEYLGIGGVPNANQYFKADKIGVFGGINYLTSIEGLSLKAEFDGSKASTEPPVAALRTSDFPFNFGANYSVNDWVNVQVGLIRGQSFSINFGLKTNFIGEGAYKPEKRKINVPTRIYYDRAKINKDESNKLTRGKTVIDYPSLYKDLSAFGYDVKYQAFENGAFYITLDTNDNSGSTDNPETKKTDILRIIEKALPDHINIYVINGVNQFAGAFARGSSEIITASSIVTDASLKASDGLSASLGYLYAPFTVSDEMKNSVNNAMMPYFTSIGYEQTEPTNLALLRAQKQTDEVFSSMIFVGAEPQSLSIINEKLIIEDRVNTGEAVVRRARLAQTARSLGANQIEITNDDLYNSKGIRQFSQFDHNRHGMMVFQSLSQHGIGIDGLKMEGNEATIRITGTHYRKPMQTYYFAIREAARNLPAEIEFITIKLLIGDVEVNKIRFPRRSIEKMSAGQMSSDELLIESDILQPDSTPKRIDMPFELDHGYPNFGWSLQPKLRQHIGDPDLGLILFQFDAQLIGTINLAQGLNFTAIGKQKIAGNFGRLNRESDSVLPRVRSELVNYSKQGTTSINRLQLDYSTQFAQNWYVRGTAGIMEEMFAGVGAEVLYRPWNRRWAVSVDWNWVKQRHFKQLLGFRKYSAWTGHATLYYDVPFYDVQLKLSAGQYLAGDRGITIDISREFESGVQIGAFSTFTNVSAAEFGEGSFDKGFYIRFPMELFLQTHTRQTNYFMFRPLTRDGGQKLHVGPELYTYIDDNQVYDLQKDWGEIYK